MSIQKLLTANLLEYRITFTVIPAYGLDVLVVSFGKLDLVSLRDSALNSRHLLLTKLIILHKIFHRRVIRSLIQRFDRTTAVLDLIIIVDRMLCLGVDLGLLLLTLPVLQA